MSADDGSTRLEQPGAYLLYGPAVDGKLAVYVGMSTTSMRDRIRAHHLNPAKNWFGVLFAVPVPSARLCPAIESELIGQVTEAGVVDVIRNVATESRYRGAGDAHVEPAVEKIRDALQLVLGSDIFTPADFAEPQTTDALTGRSAPLSRENRGQASEPRPRTPNDPPAATHGYVGSGIQAWGRFEADDPDKRFRVLTGSQFREPVLNPENATYDQLVKLTELQDTLAGEGVLDPASMTFAREHVFDNWTRATRVVSGTGLSGASHWQPLIDHGD